MAGNVESNPSPVGAYRKHLPDLNQPRFQVMAKQNAHEYADDFKTNGNPYWLFGLYQYWLDLLQEPFRGVTTDGKVRPDLFHLQDEGIPINDIVGKTEKFLSLLSPEQRSATCYHVDSPQWRTWSNPEFLLSHKGVRLDEVNEDMRSSVLSILETTLSPEGYDKARKAMRVNHFLGQICNSHAVMNEFSYNFVLFGTPRVDGPWGFSFYGHHLCLNIFFYKTQIVISPWFTGAEPNEIDEGPWAGTKILYHEADLGLELMRSLPQEQKDQAQIYKEMHDPAMPEGRWNRDDQRHLCGAYRDNRIVPNEGVCASSMTSTQQQLLRAVVEEYLKYLPQRSREMKLDHVVSFVDETYFSWIGGYGLDDPFYFRIQNPVIIVEFDHHSGVILTNHGPKKYHIHTILRTPNGGDYGHALRPLCPGVVKPFKAIM